MVSRRFLVGALVLLLSGAANAQTLPERSVRLIVPYPAGGNVDGAARILADNLQTKFGQPFVVENKAGAGGLIAGEMFAKAAADGYTLFVGSNGPVLFAPEIAKRDVYDWRRDFAPVAAISMTPMVLDVHPSVAARTFQEFVELARREPGRLALASPGPGTSNHLLSELMRTTLGVNWVTVHYRGNAPAANDLIAGHVQFGLDQLSVALLYIESRLVRPLAISGNARSPSLLDVPTFAELGFDEFNSQTFTGIFSPAGTPQEIVDRLHEAVVEALSKQDVVAKFNAVGAQCVIMSVSEFRDYLDREDRKWIPVIRAAKIAE
ncbi:tripartite tricarboxylate transporter substrate binding protein [Bradyrhizobium tropiciagri]|uniref:Bug family tripartite tricarboxylate transporter substrate binding protein n=1 Tax=Bradyrhizobium tropiciagri TaxID=312253 RepID=UPI001BAAE90A|nr:tripartite tricarboxylate transporter substrate binding protein [Bradyrhizobium tropiciagri]MBR0896743.1 tripartite tricarboxylate transporter substrate binding protein [Bradyrhizobium tropiciagri]